MNSVLNATVAAALGFLIGQMSGCVSSSNLVDTWHDSTFKAWPLSEVLISPPESLKRI